MTVRNLALTGFRYDVILRKRGDATQVDAPPPQVVTSPEPCSLDALRALLRDEPASLHVAGIPNLRLAAEVRAAELARD